MVVAYLALDESPAVLVGRLMFLLGLPATGLTLLIIGLGRRSRARRQTPQPAVAGSPDTAAGKSGTALIAVGAVLLALS
ncbi:hypothetical protein B8W68_25155, partial [Mycobacterium paraintracellulare]